MKKVILKNIKENDVFRFIPNSYDEFSNWCRENIFITRKDDKGKIYFTDTYWGYDEGQNKAYSFSEANKIGKLRYMFNFNEVEEIQDYEQNYYNDEDIYRLTNQHACVPSCINYFIKKGTEKSKKKMLKVLEDKIKEAKYQIEYNIREIESLSERKTKLENGDLTIYI